MNKNIQYTIKDIELMLDHFMDGTSSLEEESALALYFRTHDVGEEWKEYKEMFALFDNGEVACTEKAELPVRHARVFSLSSSRWSRYASVAASIVIICTCAISLFRFESESQREMARINASLTITDKEINAYLSEVAGEYYYRNRHEMNATDILDDIKQREAYLHSQIQ